MVRIEKAKLPLNRYRNVPPLWEMRLKKTFARG